jgi:hypothetical protein
LTGVAVDAEGLAAGVPVSAAASADAAGSDGVEVLATVDGV